jgi:dephospho-CoA kinase
VYLVVDEARGAVWREISMPSILGLTGNIASGKTTVGLILLELGAYAYEDADQVVHELYLPGQPLVQLIVAAFGTQMLDASGGIDRRRLGDLVFHDVSALRQLEVLVHPAVQNALVARLRQIPADGIGILDAVKLVEAGYAPFCQGIWVVTCPEHIQMQRLVEQRELTPEAARARLATQPPMAPRLEVATEVIDNSGSLDDLRRAVTAAWRRFVAVAPIETRAQEPC